MFPIHYPLDQTATLLFQAGDREGLIQTLTPWIYSIIHKHHRADQRLRESITDLFHDVVVRILMGIHGFDPAKGRLLDYVSTITVNTIRSHYYKNGDRYQQDNQLDPTVHDHPDQTEQPLPYNPADLANLWDRCSHMSRFPRRDKVMMTRLVHLIRNKGLIFVNYADLANQIQSDPAMLKDMIRRTKQYLQDSPSVLPGGA